MAAISSTVLPLELESVVRDFSNARVDHDQQWIVTLIQKQGQLVVSLLWKMLGSEQDALDAYQSTICRLISQGQDAIGTNRAGYFYRAAMNAGIEMLRMRKRRQRHWPSVAEFWRRRQSEDEPVCDLGEVEDVDRLRGAIGKLPPHLRDVIVLREMAGLPYRQLASILQIGVATARLYRRQAVLRLADMLKAEHGRRECM
jgi:RNA polymerase sigma factor (sigma-70 family)